MASAELSRRVESVIGYPPDGIGAIQRPLLQGDQHDVRVTERKDAIKVPTRVRVPEFAHDLHVRLRHRPPSIH